MRAATSRTTPRRPVVRTGRHGDRPAHGDGVRGPPRISPRGPRALGRSRQGPAPPGLVPEDVDAQGHRARGPRLPHSEGPPPGNQLRPEIVESAYTLHRHTRDPRYLEMGRTIFDGLVACSAPRPAASRRSRTCGLWEEDIRDWQQLPPPDAQQARPASLVSPSNFMPCSSYDGGDPLIVWSARRAAEERTTAKGRWTVERIASCWLLLLPLSAAILGLGCGGDGELMMPTPLADAAAGDLNSDLDPHSRQRRERDCLLPGRTGCRPREGATSGMLERSSSWSICVVGRDNWRPSRRLLRVGHLLAFLPGGSALVGRGYEAVGRDVGTPRRCWVAKIVVSTNSGGAGARWWLKLDGQRLVTASVDDPDLEIVAVAEPRIVVIADSRSIPDRLCSHRASPRFGGR